MATLNDKQIWDEVFDGDLQTAIERTRTYRNIHITSKNSCVSSLEPLALYLEPSLNSNNGHQLNLARCYIQLLKQLGYRTKVAHALKNSLQQNNEDWLPYFLVGHHTRSSRDICSRPELEIVEQYFLSEFEQIIRESNPRVCIFATIRFTNVLAAAKALITNKIQNVVFGVMEAADVPDCNNRGFVRSAFSQAAVLLQEQNVSHLLIAETDHVKTFLIDCGFREEDVKMFPYVAAKLITDIPKTSTRSTKNIHIGYVGGSRSVRHPELIADLLVSEVLPATIDLSVQLDLDYIRNTCGQITCDKINKMHRKGSITLYSPNLSEQQYRALFCSLDFVIMPYGERYQQIGSGILIEAIYANVIPILPEDSNMSSLYKSLGGNAPCFTSLSATAISEAIIDATLWYSTLRKTTNSVQRKWQQHPSASEQWERNLENWFRNQKSSKQ
jgi:hypothetical protein